MMSLEQRLIDDLTDKLRARNLQRTAAVRNAYQALHDFYDARKRQREDVGPRNKRVSLTELLVSVLPQVNGHVVKTRTLRELVLKKYPLRSAGNTQVLLSCKELGRKGYLRKVAGGWMKNVALLAVWLLLAGFVFAISAAVPVPEQENNPFQQRVAWTPSLTPNISVYALDFTTNNPPTAGFVRVVITNYSWGTNLLASITNGFWKTNFVSGVTNWLMLTAVALTTDGWSESDPTPAIPHVPPKPPTQFRLLLQISPETDGPWETLTNVPPVEVITDKPRLFTRIIQERVASP